MNILYLPWLKVKATDLMASLLVPEETMRSMSLFWYDFGSQKRENSLAGRHWSWCSYTISAGTSVALDRLRTFRVLRTPGSSPPDAQKLPSGFARTML